MRTASEAVKEAVHGAGAGLFEIFVVLPVILGFLEPVGAQLLVVRDVIHAFVISQHGNHLVVHFTAIIKFHDADDARLHQTSRHERLGHADDFHIQRIAILIPGAGNAAIGKGIGEGGIAHPIKF